MPPIAPAMPPIPTTELTACFGNISDAAVNIFVAHAWWDATARLINATAAQTLVTYCAKMIESSNMAIINRTVFLAFNAAIPPFIRREEKYPPAILPTVVAE